MEVIKKKGETQYGLIGNGVLFFENPFLSFAEPDTEENRAFMEKLFAGIGSGIYSVGGGTKAQEELVVTPQEAAKMLKISRPIVYNLTRRADFPTLRIGTKILIPVDKLKEWVETHSLAEEDLLGA